MIRQIIPGFKIPDCPPGMPPSTNEDWAYAEQAALIADELVKRSARELAGKLGFSSDIQDAAARIIANHVGEDVTRFVRRMPFTADEKARAAIPLNPKPEGEG